MSLLEIKNLNVRFGDATAVPVVDGLDLTVEKGEVLAIVGESGSGKSVTMMALMGLIEHPGIVTADALNFDGKNMLKLSNRQRRQIVGKDLAMVFQDPMTALNPSYTVGFQIEEVLRLHLKLSGKAARKRAIELLEKVEIPGAASRMDAYPHQLSGGMSQRVAIAMAIAGEPKLLIADEPTTALDVTIQAQIMDLLLALQKEQNMGLVLITHDLAVVAETAQRVCDVRRSGGGSGQGAAAVRHPRPPVQRSAAGGDSGAQHGRRAPGDLARHRARSLRPPTRLPAVAALPVRAGQLPSTTPGP